MADIGWLFTVLQFWDCWECVLSAEGAHGNASQHPTRATHSPYTSIDTFATPDEVAQKWVRGKRFNWNTIDGEKARRRGILTLLRIGGSSSPVLSNKGKRQKGY